MASINSYVSFKGCFKLRNVLVSLVSCSVLFLLLQNLAKQQVIATKLETQVVLQPDLCESNSFFARWQQQNKQAAQRLDQQCRESAVDRSWNMTIMKWMRLLVDEKRKVIYCSLPKIASTNWRRVFLTFGGVAAQPEDIPYEVAFTKDTSKVRFLETYDDATAARMLQSFDRMIFVREPFERVVSAFLDKVSPPGHFHDSFLKLFHAYRPPGANANSDSVSE